MSEEPTTLEEAVLESVITPRRPCLIDLRGNSISSVLRNRRSVPEPVQEERKSIPEEDLIVIEKIYHKDYPDCGRKRGALLRYIKEMRKNHEPETSVKDIIRLIERH